MKLKTELMFKLLKVVKKIGILQELKSFYKNVSTKNQEELEQLQAEVGMDLVIRIISDFDKAEEEFYELIACAKEIDVNQARELDFSETEEVLKAIFSSGVFKGFLSFLSR